MSADNYICEGCQLSRCPSCTPIACTHGRDLCGWCAADECGACKTDAAWERTNVVNIETARSNK